MLYLHAGNYYLHTFTVFVRLVALLMVLNIVMIFFLPSIVVWLNNFLFKIPLTFFFSKHALMRSLLSIADHFTRTAVYLIFFLLSLFWYKVNSIRVHVCFTAVHCGQNAKWCQILFSCTMKLIFFLLYNVPRYPQYAGILHATLTVALTKRTR